MYGVRTHGEAHGYLVNTDHLCYIRNRCFLLFLLRISLLLSWFFLLTPSDILFHESHLHDSRFLLFKHFALLGGGVYEGGQRHRRIRRREKREGRPFNCHFPFFLLPVPISFPYIPALADGCKIKAKRENPILLPLRSLLCLLLFVSFSSLNKHLLL